MFRKWNAGWGRILAARTGWPATTTKGFKVFEFYDLHSGGDQKTEFRAVYVEEDEREVALSVFRGHLGVDPEESACSCCGSDYAIEEVEGVDFSLAPLLVIDGQGRKTVTQRLR